MFQGPVKDNGGPSVSAVGPPGEHAQPDPRRLRDPLLHTLPACPSFAPAPERSACILILGFTLQLCRVAHPCLCPACPPLGSGLDCWNAPSLTFPLPVVCFLRCTCPLLLSLVPSLTRLCQFSSRLSP